MEYSKFVLLYKEYNGLGDSMDIDSWDDKSKGFGTEEELREYISELNKEIKRCMNWQDNNYYKLGSLEFEKMCSRVMTLQEVRNDLKGRLDELV